MDEEQVRVAAVVFSYLRATSLRNASIGASRMWKVRTSFFRNAIPS